MANVNIELGYKTAAWFTANPTVVLKSGQIVYQGQTGLYKIGDGTTQLSVLSFLGNPNITLGTTLQYFRGDLSLATFPTNVSAFTNDSAYITLASITSALVTGKLLTGYVQGAGTVGPTDSILSAFNKITGNIAALVTGVSSVNGNVGAVPLTGTTNRLTVSGTNQFDISATFEALLGKVANPLSQFAATTSAQLAGVISDETGTGSLVFSDSPVFTTQILSPLIYGSSLASGTLTLHSTSHATKGGINIAPAGGFVNMGNYASPTAQRLVTIGQDTAFMSLGSQSGSTARPAIYFNQTAPDTTNFSLSSHQTANTTYLNGKSGVSILTNGGIVSTWGASTILFAVGAGSANNINYQFSVPNNTALTVSTEIPIFKILGGNNTWPTGAITLQRWNLLTANTSNFSGASTITYCANFAVDAPASGTFSTITNKLAALFNGSVSIGNSLAPTLGGGDGVLFIANAGTNPGTNPTGGGILYVNAGALTYRGSSGTVTVLAAA